MKKLLLIACSICMAVSLVACSSGSTSTSSTTSSTTSSSTSSSTTSTSTATTGDVAKTDLTVIMSTDMVSFDPMASSSLLNQGVLNLVYDRLFQLDDDLQGVPYLVENYTWLDDDSCELTIYDSVTFPSGRNMDTEDVKYSLEHAMENGYLTFIDEIEIVDETTFIVHCTGAYPALPTALSSRTTYILPQEYYEEASTSGDWSSPVGSGRYTLDSRVAGDSVTLVAKEDYWNQDDAALNDSLTFKVIPEGTNRTIMIETGEADLNVSFATADYSRVTEDSSLKLWSHYSSTIFYLGMDNLNEYLSNVSVRQAINYAIDRDSVVLAAYDGLGTAHYSYLPPSGLGYLENPSNYSYDLDKAKELMAEAGYADGFELDLIAWNDSMEKIATVIQAYLMQINITTNIIRIESSVMNSMAVAGEAPMWVASWGCYADPDMHLGSLFTRSMLGTTNRFRLDDDYFETLYQEARSTDESVRIEKYQEIQTYMCEQAIMAPLFINEIFALSNSELQGVQLNTESGMNYHTLHY